MKSLKRSFHTVTNIELEICIDDNNKKFVRHHTYWYIVHEKKNPDPIYNCVIDNLEILVNHRLKTIKWSGYKFEFETVIFDDGMKVEAVLIPINMFEDFISYQSTNYREKPPDNQCTRLAKWLENNSLNDLK
jgi:hypothetical protein